MQAYNNLALLLRDQCEPWHAVSFVLDERELGLRLCSDQAGTILRHQWFCVGSFVGIMFPFQNPDLLISLQHNAQQTEQTEDVDACLENLDVCISSWVRN